MPSGDSAARARRLLALLPYLATIGDYPVAEVAARVGTDEATLVDDLTTLSMCGTDPRDPGSMVAVFVEGDLVTIFGPLPSDDLGLPVRLTAGETRALAAALEMAGQSGTGPLSDRLAEAAARDLDTAELASTVKAAFADGGAADLYRALLDAVTAHEVVRIRHAGADDAVERERLVHPWALANRRGAWYLRGWCEDADAERTFRLDRVSSVKATGRHFGASEVPRSPGVFDPLASLSELPRADVRFAADAGDLTSRDWPGATFEPQADGGVLASVPYAGTAWIARKVVSRLGDAEVTRPPEVRRAVERMARDLLGEEQVS
jgi:proteasome accessory factor C